MWGVLPWGRAGAQSFLGVVTSVDPGSRHRGRQAAWGPAKVKPEVFSALLPTPQVQAPVHTHLPGYHRAGCVRDWGHLLSLLTTDPTQLLRDRVSLSEPEHKFPENWAPQTPLRLVLISPGEFQRGFMDL